MSGIADINSLDVGIRGVIRQCVAIGTIQEYACIFICVCSIPCDPASVAVLGDVNAILLARPVGRVPVKNTIISVLQVYAADFVIGCSISCKVTVSGIFGVNPTVGVVVGDIAGEIDPVCTCNVDSVVGVEGNVITCNRIVIRCNLDTGVPVTGHFIPGDVVSGRPGIS